MAMTVVAGRMAMTMEGGWRMAVGYGDDGGAGDDECRSRMSIVVAIGLAMRSRAEDGHEGGGRWR